MLGEDSKDGKGGRRSEYLLDALSPLFGRFMEYVTKKYPHDIRMEDLDLKEEVEEFAQFYEAQFLGSGEFGKIEIEEMEIPGSERKLIKLRETRYDKKGH